jgi:hypothetical protein
VVSEFSPDQRTLPLDVWRLRLLSFANGRHRLPEGEQGDLFRRVLARWPDEASPLLRLAALAHGLDEDLETRLPQAPQQLAELSGRDPAGLKPDETRTILLAALVRAEQFDYPSFVSDRGTSLVLRDALTDREDLAAVGAIVRWETLMRLSVSTPDDLLRSWSKHVSSLARDARHWDVAEYDNTLDIRGHLQRLSASLSCAGQGQWREHIEPADDVFRGCTERVDAPLVLAPRAEPAGWWRYRVPAVEAERFREGVARTIDARRYVGAPDARGRAGKLRTVGHVWDLAERPDGLRAMTNGELGFWSRMTGRQAEHEGERPGSTVWQDRHRAAEREWRRRAADGGAKSA